MSKFIEYKTEYYDKEQAAAAFPEIQSPKPGYYVSHPRKKVMGPYENRERAIRYISSEIYHDVELEKLAEEQKRGG